jgi:hypothetical protein
MEIIPTLPRTIGDAHVIVALKATKDTPEGVYTVGKK